MPITSCYAVTVVFAAGGFFGPPQGDAMEPGCTVRLVEDRGATGKFSLRGRGVPAYGLKPRAEPEWSAPLTDEQNGRLLDLVARLEVPQPPPRLPGFDGTWFTLMLLGGSHSLRLDWWADPPPGWESAAALFDYGRELAKLTYSS